MPKAKIKKETKEPKKAKKIKEVVEEVVEVEDIPVVSKKTKSVEAPIWVDDDVWEGMTAEQQAKMLKH